jgi:hypothetical protein
MAGFVSVRLSKEERKKLLALKAERGCKSISQVVRLMLGFPRGSDEGLEGADDIESVDRMCELLIRAVDRIDELTKVETKIARHLNVPLELGLREIMAAAKNGRPIHPPPDLETPMDPDVLMPTRNGHKHPEMPAGFSRG